jgi:hypothetical protein
VETIEENTVNAEPSTSAQYFAEPTDAMLALRQQVSATLTRHADSSGIPTHNTQTDALWIWQDNDGVLHALRSSNDPHPRSVVASWNTGSRRLVSFEDFLDAVMLELVG